MQVVSNESSRYLSFKINYEGGGTSIPAGEYSGFTPSGESDDDKIIDLLTHYIRNQNIPQSEKDNVRGLLDSIYTNDQVGCSLIKFI